MSRFRLSSEQLAVTLVFVVIGTLAALAPAQSDTWWLLREGHEILRRGSVSLTDAYSHTATGLFWPNHEWVTELVFFAAYRVGGLPLITALCAAIILLTWAASWRLTRGGFEVRFLLFAGAIALSASGWALRPQVFSMALFVATAAACVRGATRWLPLLFLLWANLHGAVALGIVVLAANVIAHTWFERRVPWALVATTIASGAATLVSPLTWRLWTYIPESIARSRANQLIEWQPPEFVPLYLPFWVLAAALVGLAALEAKRLDLPGRQVVVMALAVLPLAVQARRNVPVFLLVAVPAIGALVASRWPPAPPPRARGENERANGLLAWGTILIASAGIGTAWILQVPQLGWQPISSDAIRAIRSCQGPLYNTYGDGGVLIWFVPERPVFIDNRQDPYPIDLLQENLRVEMGGQYEDLFRRYGITCAVVGAASPTAQRLRSDRAWSIVHPDDRWTVFAREPSTPAGPLPR